MGPENILPPLSFEPVCENTVNMKMIQGARKVEDPSFKWPPQH